MANQVASKNPFALLNDEYDDDAKAPAPAAASSTQPVVEPKPNQKKIGGSTRGGRYYQRGSTKPVTSTETPAAPNEEKKQYNRGDRGDRADRGERGGYRGGRGGGRGRGRGVDRDARPDRHSATGIVDSQKKYHQGWGGDRGDTELKDATNGADDATAAAAGDGWGAANNNNDASGWDAPAATNDAADPWATPATEGAAAEGENSNEKTTGGGEEGTGDKPPRRKYEEDDEDANKMTLDEYRAKKAGGESEIIPKLEPRAVEGSSDYFKNAVQITKDLEASNYFVGKKEKAGSGHKTRKEGKQYIEIEARFDPPARGRGRGRGRGEGRGGGDYRGGGGGDYRGGGRGERGGGYRNRPQQQQAVDVEDTNAFPAL